MSFFNVSQQEAAGEHRECLSVNVFFNVCTLLFAMSENIAVIDPGCVWQGTGCLCNVYLASSYSNTALEVCVVKYNSFTKTKAKNV